MDDSQIAKIVVFSVLFDLVKSMIKGAGVIGFVPLRDGTEALRFNLEIHTSLWAEGDKAWRIKALEELAEMYEGEGGVHYRNVRASFVCRSIDEKRQLMSCLELICERTNW